MELVPPPKLWKPRSLEDCALVSQFLNSVQVMVSDLLADGALCLWAYWGHLPCL